MKLRKKLRDTTDLGTTTVLTINIGEVERKILDVSSLIRKTDYNAKISDLEKFYFATSDCNKCTSETLDAKIKEKGLINKCNISNLGFKHKTCNISNKSKIKTRA